MRPVLGFLQRLGAAYQRVALIGWDIHPGTARHLTIGHGRRRRARSLDARTAQRLQRVANLIGAVVVDAVQTNKFASTRSTFQPGRLSPGSLAAPAQLCQRPSAFT